MKKSYSFFVIISALSFASCSQSDKPNPATPAVVTPANRFVLNIASYATAERIFDYGAANRKFST
ncbi:MAG: hypothetical protein IPL12_22140 [Bacteroidetes bacterium]|nr:hypothetical protein [Bacteroidota bacterium]